MFYAVEYKHWGMLTDAEVGHSEIRKQYRMLKSWKVVEVWREVSLEFDVIV